MNREIFVRKLDEDIIWDIVVIGGGATGLGCAVDSAARGYKTLLLEQADFSKGTSSRSTKLIHGGVRYLQQGDILLVLEALRERSRILKNAPHLSCWQSFLIPTYRWFDRLLFGVGLKMYDFLAMGHRHKSSRFLSKEDTLKSIKSVIADKLKGSILYYDGKFDDARLAVNLAQTCFDLGGYPINYMRVEKLIKGEEGRITGLMSMDLETGLSHSIKVKQIINCAGVFADDIIRMDESSAKKNITPSRGVHLVIDRKFLPGDTALMVPKTDDGRVLFAIPWHDKVVAGTTDIAVNEISLEPDVSEEEINFILRNVSKYLSKAPTKTDILSVFAGLRPLAATENLNKTKEISRSHKIITSTSGLITVLGGKWTTYRKMAEDAVNIAAASAKLAKVLCPTRDLKIHGWQVEKSKDDPLSIYGSDAEQIREIMKEYPSFADRISCDFAYTKAEVIWAVRNEMARTVEDVLARRLRCLFLNPTASEKIAPEVAVLMAKELGHDQKWIDSQLQYYFELTEKYKYYNEG